MRGQHLNNGRSRDRVLKLVRDSRMLRSLELKLDRISADNLAGTPEYNLYVDLFVGGYDKIGRGIKAGLEGQGS